MGSNKNGSLGIGPETANSFSPMLVSSLADHKAIKIASGGEHTLALLDTGDLFSWGLNSQGQLGLNSKETQYFPQKLHYFQGGSKSFCDIAAGYNHSFILTKEGAILSFGGNTFGQLGNGSKLKQMFAKKIDAFASGRSIIKIACGFNFTLFLSDKGEVYSCGDNSFGQLGLGKTLLSTELPLQVSFPPEGQFIVRISAGSFSAALTDHGKLFLWGLNFLTNTYEPTAINFSHSLKDVAIGSDYGIALCTKGKVYAWGRNENGELGIGGFTNNLEIEENPYFSKKKVIAVSCGEHHVMALGESLIKGEENEHSLAEKWDLGQTRMNVEKTVKKIVIEKKAHCSIKENCIKNRKELGEIDINSGENRGESKEELVKMNNMLKKNFENIDNALKVYCQKEKENYQDSKTHWQLSSFSKNELPQDPEDKVKYLLSKLIEKDTQIAELQHELIKKEALEHALLYKISFLEKNLNNKTF